MKITTITLSLFIAATASALPAKAESLHFGIYGPNGGFSISTSDNSTPYVAVNDRQRIKKKKRNKRHVQYIEPLSPRQIARKLRRKGFYGLHNMRYNDVVYKVRAYNRRGRLVKLKLDAYNGEILKRRRLDDYRPHRHEQYGWSYGWSYGYWTR